MVNNELMPSIGLGRWHFVLERMDGPERLEAADCESYIHHDRLALLAVVRGLEALEQASLVRLVTTSRYVDRGLRFGLPNWRETNYQWESFGERKSVRNADLWRRVDVAMQYHNVNCRLLKSNVASAESEGSSIQEFQEPTTAVSAALTNATNSAAHPMTTAPIRSTELVGRFAPSRVAYRVDAPHRAISASNRSRTNRATPKVASHAARLQWWEMAANWDNPALFAGSQRESAYET
jgi:ribonuclease HI